MASARRHASHRAYPGSDSGALNHPSLARSLALDIALSLGLFDRMLPGHACHCGHQRHPAMLGLDLIEAEQYSRVKAAVHRANMPLYPFAARNNGSPGSGQVFRQLGLEMFARLRLAGIQLVAQANDEFGTFGNQV